MQAVDKTWTSTEIPPYRIMLKLQAGEPLTRSQSQSSPMQFPQYPYFVPPYPIPLYTTQQGATTPMAELAKHHPTNVPADFPKMADQLKEVASDWWGDEHPWEWCAPELVKAEYLRINQIEDTSPEDLVGACEGIIKLPTAKLLQRYAADDCRKIRGQKALYAGIAGI